MMVKNDSSDNDDNGLKEWPKYGLPDYDANLVSEEAYNDM